MEIVEPKRKKGRSALDAITFGIVIENVNCSTGSSIKMTVR